MKQRIQDEGNDSDFTRFYNNMLYGEMVIKWIVCGIAAGIEDDVDRNQYQIYYNLIRSNAIGDWVTNLEKILQQLPSQYLIEEVKIKERKELTEKVGSGKWQYEMALSIFQCLNSLDESTDNLPTKVDALEWFRRFVTLRNKFRGHGAQRGAKCAELCEMLENSIDILVNNFILFKRPCVFLYRNLSKKYRVSQISESNDYFESLKTEEGKKCNYEDGIFIAFGTDINIIKLVESDADLSDFYFSNGQYNDKNCDYEMLSYITGNKIRNIDNFYTVPIETLPKSETSSMGELDVFHNNVFSNIPTQRPGYIKRLELENQLKEQLLLTERHPIITLQGKGGIGKTTLALQVLHEIAQSPYIPYKMIIWLSARDIDLTSEGPKAVKPDVISKKQFSKEYALLVLGKNKAKGMNYEEYFSSQLSKGALGPTLFIFDNFETVENPFDVFKYLDSFIRLPNKILITTRIRDFKADYPLIVSGMTKNESFQLIENISNEIGLSQLLHEEYKLELYKESGGHPYIIKILLGECAKKKQLVKPDIVLQDLDKLLDALFERSYINLSKAAQRIFLLLCSWKSAIPEIALELAMLSAREKIDVSETLNELVNSSFIEEEVSENDNFYYAPLAALTFGKRKLKVSSLKAIVEVDSIFLQKFGVTKSAEIKKGILPKINRFVRKVAEEISSGTTSLAAHKNNFDYIASKVPQAWLSIAKLYKEQDNLDNAIETTRKYLEREDGEEGKLKAWEELTKLYELKKDYKNELLTLVEISQNRKLQLYDLSNIVNRIIILCKTLKDLDRTSAFEVEEKKLMLKKVITVIELRDDELDPTDCSRVAWLFLNIGDTKKALDYAKKGLDIDKANYYCRSLIERIDKEYRGRTRKGDKVVE